MHVHIFLGYTFKFFLSYIVASLSCQNMLRRYTYIGIRKNKSLRQMPNYELGYG